MSKLSTLRRFRRLRNRLQSGDVLDWFHGALEAARELRSRWS